MFSWLKKRSEPPEPPPQTDNAPAGEVEKLLRIKHLCLLAWMSADNIVGLSNEQLKDEDNKYERDRYDKLLLEATNLAREITDVFYRDAALHQLIKPLMTAGDESQAKKLFSIIEVDVIQDAVLKEFPRPNFD